MKTTTSQQYNKFYRSFRSCEMEEWEVCQWYKARAKPNMSNFVKKHMSCCNGFKPH